jgi:hypothetical protein
MIERRQFTIRLSKAELILAVKAYFATNIGVHGIPAEAALAVLDSGKGLDFVWTKDMTPAHRSPDDVLVQSPQLLLAAPDDGPRAA